MKLRKYLRGSGRILAFIFVASVVWLLFDMAALRLSFSDTNGQRLREVVVKEREVARRQEIKATNFRNPIRKVEEKSTASKQLERKVVEVYRRGKKFKQEEKVLNKPDLHIKTTIEKKSLSKHLKTSENTNTHVKEAEAAAAGQETNVHQNQIVKLQSDLNKDHQVPPEVPVLPTTAAVGVGVKSNHTLKTQPVKASAKFVLGFDKGHNPVNKSNFLQMTVKPHLPNNDQPGVLLSSRSLNKTSGFHKVMNLDVTLKPRDAQAPGQYGQAAEVPPDMQEESRRRWSEGYFNVYLSNQIPVDRAIPDTRPPSCKEQLVPNDLPTTSVIFCFVDEVWSTLLRSVHSVLNRSPPHLLKEILLVDDCSSKDYLKEGLDAYMAQFPKVRIIRLKERHGLIRARMVGAAEAKGDVLTFLDSHIECNVGWLEPLLERVYLDRRKVPCPVIEVVSDKDMSYVLVDNFQRGIFRWPLVFGWSTLSKDYIQKNNIKVSDPIRCPVMAGGLFSIDKKYFYELGAYDPGLDVWGGENMEISFKIWMCGGEIEIIPCSRVGHIFRGENPYGFPKDRKKTVERNLVRVAEVWLDEYKEVFYGHGYLHLLEKNAVDMGNLSTQIQLRENLQCKSFKWYLENVYPEMNAPPVKAEGLVFNLGIRKCLALKEGSLSFEICDLSKQSQQFSYSWVKTLRQNTSCLFPKIPGGVMAVEACDNSNPNHRWLHKSGKVLTEHLIAEGSQKNMCLEAETDGGSICLKPCNESSRFQKWQFTHYYI